MSVIIGRLIAHHKDSFAGMDGREAPLGHCETEDAARGSPCRPRSLHLILVGPQYSRGLLGIITAGQSPSRRISVTPCKEKGKMGIPEEGPYLSPPPDHQRDLSAHFIVLEAGNTELLVIVKVARVACFQKGEIAVWTLLHTDLRERKEGNMESGRRPHPEWRSHLMLMRRASGNIKGKRWNVLPEGWDSEIPAEPQGWHTSRC